MEDVRGEIEKLVFGYLDLSERAQDPGELIDKIAALITNKEPVADVLCNAGLSAQLKIATDALNMIGSGTEDLMPPYRSMGASQMKDVAYKALTEINNIDEVSR